MHFKATSFDALQLAVIQRLLDQDTSATPTRGAVRELHGITLELTNPRARLSRTTSRGLVFSCLGEWIWYMSGRDDLETMEYYLPGIGTQNSDDGATLHGAYGKRLLNMRGHNQLQNIIQLLNEKPSSRRAVIQLFDAEDIAEEYMDVPCTCVLQFLVRNQRLHMITYMRSNDVIKGLPHDFFSFTMLQETVARTIGVEVGTYKHVVGSLHLYEAPEDLRLAERVANEGKQPLLPMLPMPKEDPWDAIEELVTCEQTLRCGEQYDEPKLDKYWLDLIRLLEVFRCYKNRDGAGMRVLRNQVARVYRMYIDRKTRDLARRVRRRLEPKVTEQTRLDI